MCPLTYTLDTEGQGTTDPPWVVAGYEVGGGRLCDCTYILVMAIFITAHCACAVILYPIKMAKEPSDNSLYPIAVLIDELRNDDVNVSKSVGEV